jgi:predicted nucleic acid-binding protein
MGLLLDSTVLISAERAGWNSNRTLRWIEEKVGPAEIAISVVSLVELAHGAARAALPERKLRRLEFLRELQTAIPIHPVSVAVALRAGQIDGENNARGISVALADLLIRATALQLGYQVATSNVRHFRSIPGLEILSI